MDVITSFYWSKILTGKYEIKPIALNRIKNNKFLTIEEKYSMDNLNVQ